MGGGNRKGGTKGRREIKNDDHKWVRKYKKGLLHWKEKTT